MYVCSQLLEIAVQAWRQRAKHRQAFSHACLHSKCALWDTDMSACKTITRRQEIDRETAVTSAGFNPSEKQFSWWKPQSMYSSHVALFSNPPISADDVIGGSWPNNGFSGPPLLIVSNTELWRKKTLFWAEDGRPLSRPEPERLGRCFFVK
jgi:hypothetical protein